jgi:hypothetical protein
MPCRSTNSLPRASGDSPGRHDDDGLGGAGRFGSVRHENIDPQGGPIGTPDRGAGLNPTLRPADPEHDRDPIRRMGTSVEDGWRESSRWWPTVGGARSN